MFIIIDLFIYLYIFKRLFYRWVASVLSYFNQDATHPARDESDESNIDINLLNKPQKVSCMNLVLFLPSSIEFFQIILTVLIIFNNIIFQALKVTPLSIKAFILYFAKNKIGVQYNLPIELEQANIELMEALFFK